MCIQLRLEVPIFRFLTESYATVSRSRRPNINTGALPFRALAFLVPSLIPLVQSLLA